MPSDCPAAGDGIGPGAPDAFRYCAGQLGCTDGVAGTTCYIVVGSGKEEGGPFTRVVE